MRIYIDEDSARAIAKYEASGLAIENEFIILNQWR